MKEILDEFKQSMSGIIGAFILDNNGNVIASSMPEIMEDACKKVGKTIKNVVDVIRATKSFERMSIEAENGKFFIMHADGKVLVALTEKNINLALFKLMSNMAIVKVKETKIEEKKEISQADIESISSVYDEIFAAIARRLANVIGPKAASLFETGTSDVRRKHSNLFFDVKFSSDGKPDMAKIKANVKNISKYEFISALDELADAMISTVSANAGKVMAEKAKNDAEALRSKYKAVLS